MITSDFLASYFICLAIFVSHLSVGIFKRSMILSFVMAFVSLGFTMMGVDIILHSAR